MKGNFIWVICQPCNEAGAKDYGLCIAQRQTGGYYEHIGSPKNTDGWLWNHRNCGGRENPDHFKMGYSQTQNYDVPTDKPVAVAVKLALVK